MADATDALDAATGDTMSHTTTHAACAPSAAIKPSAEGQIHGVAAARNDGSTKGLRNDDRERWCRNAASAKCAAVTDAGRAVSTTFHKPEGD